MEQSNENGNKPILEIFINEVEMDENPIQEKSTKIPIQQIKGSRMPRNEKERMKFNLERLHIQRNKLKGSIINSMCCKFYCVNDNKEVDGDYPQIMKCIIYYNSLVIAINPRIQIRKGLISYHKTNIIIALRKHVDVKYSIITKMFEEVNSPMIRSLEM